MVLKRGTTEHVRKAFHPHTFRIEARDGRRTWRKLAARTAPSQTTMILSGRLGGKSGSVARVVRLE
eukprot:1425087-Pyramimonas_sp.AAC.1